MRGLSPNWLLGTEKAREELTALQDGGVDGILIANEFSLPTKSRFPM